MPFITSEIYSKLVQYDEKDLMVSSWPKIKEEFAFDKEEKLIENIKDIIVQIRNTRANMNVHPSKKSKLIFVTTQYKKEIEESQAFIQKLGFASEIIIKDTKKDIPQNAISILTDGIQVFIPFEDIVDLNEEKQRLEGEIKKLESEVLRASKMLSNPGFINKAPKEKIEEEKEKLAKYEEMLESTKERLKTLNN